MLRRNEMSPALAPEAVVAAFDRAVSAAPGFDTRAETIAGRVQAMLRCESVLFFSPDEAAGAFVVTPRLPPSDAAPAGFSNHGPLTRWLRVNDRALKIPDRDSVWDDLGPEEQAALRTLRARACLPLVTDDTMGAFLVVCDRRPEWVWPSDAPVGLLEECARHAAWRWREAVRQESAQRLAHATYRSQQLTTTGQLAASVAHEVRNPLAGIRSILQLVNEVQPPREKQETLLRAVIEEVDNIDRRVSDLLALARPHESEIAETNMTEIAADAVRFVEASARRGGITITTTLDVPLPVAVDRREFRQVLLNVLLNACQACAPGATIVVTNSRAIVHERPVGRVHVRDAGVGMPPGELQRVFEPFFTTKPMGTGLGLAISRDLLRRHGGDLCVESTQGQGTHVCLQLPLVED